MKKDVNVKKNKHKQEKQQKLGLVILEQQHLRITFSEGWMRQ